MDNPNPAAVNYIRFRQPLVRENSFQVVRFDVDGGNRQIAVVCKDPINQRKADERAQSAAKVIDNGIVGCVSKHLKKQHNLILLRLT